MGWGGVGSKEEMRKGDAEDDDASGRRSSGGGSTKKGSTSFKERRELTNGKETGNKKKELMIQ